MPALAAPRSSKPRAPHAKDVIPFVDLKIQYRSIKREVQAAMSRVLDSCQFVLGEPLAEFEKAFARFSGASYAVGVGSGLEALRLALRGLGIGPGDEVIVPASTYIATALAVSEVGARPVLVDCQAASGNIDPNAVERALGPRTKAVIPVHLGGLPADMDEILAIAKARGLVVLEDAAQAHGALYKGRPCGSLAHAAAFSFYPGKNLGAYGEGGMVTTSDPGLAGRLRCLRNYGQEVKYQHLVKGTNARLDTLQAAVLAVKLTRLRAWNRSRARHARLYRRLLSGVGDLSFQECPPDRTHVYHLFWAETDRRDDLAQRLALQGIQTVIHYPVPIHLQKAYADLGLRPGAFPMAERRAKRTLSLPMYPELADAQIQRVAKAVREFFA